jgi:hypothetical protein
MHIPANTNTDFAIEVCSRISGVFSEPFSQKKSSSDKQPTETTIQIIGSSWNENVIESLMRQHPYLLHNVHELQLQTFEMSAHVLSLLAPLGSLRSLHIDLGEFWELEKPVPVRLRFGTLRNLKLTDFFPAEVYQVLSSLDPSVDIRQLIIHVLRLPLGEGFSPFPDTSLLQHLEVLELEVNPMKRELAEEILRNHMGSFKHLQYLKLVSSNAVGGDDQEWKSALRHLL